MFVFISPLRLVQLHEIGKNYLTWVIRTEIQNWWARKHLYLARNYLVGFLKPRLNFIKYLKPFHLTGAGCLSLSSDEAN